MPAEGVGDTFTGRRYPSNHIISVSPEPNDLPPRTRTRKKRVKSGCLSCRRRRKKCDEAKPSCESCRTRGSKCEWPKIIHRKHTSMSPDAENNQLSREAVRKESVDSNFSDPHKPVSTVDSQPMDFCTDKTSDRPPRALDVSPERAVSPGVYNTSRASKLHTQELMPDTQDQPLEKPPQQSQAPSPEEKQHTEASVPASEGRGGHEYFRTQAQQYALLQTQSQELAIENPPRVSPHDQRRGGMQHDASKNSTSQIETTQEHASCLPRPTASHEAPFRPRTQPLFPSQYDAFTRLQLQKLPHGPPESLTTHATPQQHSLEKVKMMKGQTYSQSDSELAYDRSKCRVLLARFNAGGTVSIENRKQLMKSLLGSIGTNVNIEAPFRCEYGYNINIGNDTYIGPDCIIEDPSIVSIGARCYIGPRVTLYCKKSSPNLNDHDGCRTLFYGPGIWIEDRVCIEAGVVIHAGVRIGRGSTIVAGSVVTKSVRERSLVGGNPATVFQCV